MTPNALAMSGNYTVRPAKEHDLPIVAGIFQHLFHHLRIAIVRELALERHVQDVSEWLDRFNRTVRPVLAGFVGSAHRKNGHGPAVSRCVSATMKVGCQGCRTDLAFAVQIEIRCGVRGLFPVPDNNHLGGPGLAGAG